MKLENRKWALTPSSVVIRQNCRKGSHINFFILRGPSFMLFGPRMHIYTTFGYRLENQKTEKGLRRPLAAKFGKITEREVILISDFKGTFFYALWSWDAYLYHFWG